MEASMATPDECDGNYKSKNITVYGNATIVKQKGLSAEQLKVLEMMTVEEGKVDDSNCCCCCSCESISTGRWKCSSNGGTYSTL